MLALWHEWYYLIYLLPLGLAFVLLLVTAMMGGADGDADVSGMEADAGDLSLHAGELSVEAPAFSADALMDADFEVDTDGIGDGEGTTNGSSDGNSPGSFGKETLAFFGFGRAPLSLLLEGFMLTWGVSGVYATLSFSQALKSPSLFVPASMAVAGVCGLMGMKLIGAIGVRYMKSVETYVIRQDDLVGEIGVVTYPVSETMGRVHIYDRHGSLHIESCRVMPGQAAIPRNAKVILVQHDPKKEAYWVEPSPV